VILSITPASPGPAVSTGAATTVALAQVFPLAADIRGVFPVPQPDTPDISGGTPMAVARPSRKVS